MKSLIFLLFIAFVSSEVFPGIININYNNCKGGQIENGKCKCPDKKLLFGKECKPCANGTIMFNNCICRLARYLEGINSNYIKSALQVKH